MTVTFNLPTDIEQQLRREFVDLDQAAKEAALVELYRQQKLTHYELSTALSLSRFDVDALLHRHGVTYAITAQEVAREAASIHPPLNP